MDPFYGEFVVFVYISKTSLKPLNCVYTLSLSLSLVPSLCVMCGLHVIGELFLSEVRRVGEAQGLLSWEIPSSVLIEPEPFTQANMLLTPTLKKSRPQLEIKYKEKLEALYEELTINERNKVKMRYALIQTHYVPS